MMKIEEVTHTIGINISTRKSELLNLRRDEGKVRVKDISSRAQMKKQVEEVTYLVSVIISDGKFVQGIERRRAAANENLWNVQTDFVG